MTEVFRPMVRAVQLFFQHPFKFPEFRQGLPSVPRYCKDVLELLSVYGRNTPNSGIIHPSDDDLHLHGDGVGSASMAKVVRVGPTCPRVSAHTSL